MALYNTDLKRERTEIDCLSCEFYDKNLKACTGLGKVCFEFDRTTTTLIDPTTGLPMNYKGDENGKTK